MGKQCHSCKGQNVEEDNARGHLVCMDCGAVLEENAIVSDTAFHEGASGSHTVIGQFVSTENSYMSVGGYKQGKSSREVTLANARDRIQTIAGQLKINKSTSEMGFGFYRTALSRGFTRGRRSITVVASCLYMACRLKQVHLLLLDFSDAVQVNVFELGQIVTFYSRELHIKLPATDPCIYLMRFATSLKFGDKIKEVVSIANRLVCRMKKDWMAVGRRPTGICGAALVLAARFFKFNRTVSDIVRVVHIGEAVIRRRLKEFENTPSSQLTLDEFVEVDLEHEMDPPAFVDARQKQKQLELQIVDQLADEFNKEIDNMDVALDQARQSRFTKGRYANDSYCKISTGLAGLDASESRELQVAEQFMTSELVETIENQSNNQEKQISEIEGLRPNLKSLGLVTDSDIKQQQPTSSKAQDVDDGELDLTGIDDDEIDKYFLSHDEQRLKARLWDRQNKTYLEEQARRLEEREKEIAHREANDPNFRTKQLKRQEKLAQRKRRRQQQEENKDRTTSVDAIHMVIQEKKLSNKINYDVLKNIEQTFKREETDDILPNRVASPAPEEPLTKMAKRPTPGIFDINTAGATQNNGVVNQKPVIQKNDVVPDTAPRRRLFAKSRVNIAGTRR